MNEAGIYAISYSDQRSIGPTTFGISVNSSQLTTNIATITTANRLILTDAATALFASCSATVRLAANDVVRAHTDGGPNSTGAQVQFIITQVFKL